MKNYLYRTLLGIMMSVPAYATMNSELSLGTQDNMKFTLGFDNNTYTTASNTYNVANILPGSHHVRMMSAPGQAGACGFPRILFDGWVNIPENSKLTAYANNNLQLNIVSVVPLQNVVYVDPNVNYGNGYGNNNYGNGNNYGSGCGNDNGNSSGYTNNNYGWNNYPPQNYGMSVNDFAALKNSVTNQWFDSDKLLVAKQGANANHLSAQQIFELVKLMDFESSKLDLAKAAYANSLDKNNYYKVNDAFDFSSSVSELANYINNYHV